MYEDIKEIVYNRQVITTGSKLDHHKVLNEVIEDVNEITAKSSNINIIKVVLEEEVATK